VFVPHQPMMRSASTGQLVPKINLQADAGEFGDLVFMLDWPEIRDMNLDLIYEKLAVCLADYNDSDYIVCTGNPVAMSIAVMIAGDMNQGRVRLLYWNRGTNPRGGYEEVVADLNKAEKFLPYRN
jgi:hypothetical protein